MTSYQRDCNSNIVSGVATGGGDGGQSATPDSEKIAKHWGKVGKNRENRQKKMKNRKEKAKIGKVLSLCPSWQIGLATLLNTVTLLILVDMDRMDQNLYIGTIQHHRTLIIENLRGSNNPLGKVCYKIGLIRVNFVTNVSVHPFIYHGKC